MGKWEKGGKGLRGRRRDEWRGERKEKKVVVVEEERRREKGKEGKRRTRECRQ